MKPLKTLFLSACLLTLLAFGYTPAMVKTDKPEDLAKAVVTALKNKDEKAYTSLLPSKPELLKLLEKPGMTAEQRSSLQANIDGFVKKMNDESGADFKKTVSQGEAAGLNWAHATYSKCQAEYQNREGVDMANVEITLLAAGQSYTITLKDIIKTEHGWKTGGRLMFGTPKQDMERVKREEQARRDSVVKRTRDALKASMADSTKK